MKLAKILITIIFAFFSINAFSQTNVLIPGIWKGTSICQVKNSPCHDEQVIYHISQIGRSISFQVLMNKMVNNQEEEMGSILFEYDSLKQMLVSTDTIHNAVWVFKLEGKQIKGTLVYKEQLYRIVDVRKQD